MTAGLGGVSRRRYELAAAAGLVGLAGAYALFDWLGVRYLAQRVGQDYGVTDLLVAFVGAALVSVCCLAALQAWTTGRLPMRQVLVLLLVVALLAYWFWPGDERTYGFFAYRSTPPPWWRDVLLLGVALVAGGVAPAPVWLRRRKRE